jgi:hypothetical protein
MPGAHPAAMSRQPFPFPQSIFTALEPVCDDAHQPNVHINTVQWYRGRDQGVK